MGSINGFNKKKNIFVYILKIISWAIFTLFSIIAVFLIYYFIESKIYNNKGQKYTPEISMYTIISGSMEPQIKVYDVVFDQKVKNFSTIKVGDVITYTSEDPAHPGMIITHRVTESIKKSDGYYFRTKGDNNSQEDSKEVFESQVIGKVIMKFPQLGRIQMIVTNNLGWIIFVLIPALAIIIFDVIKVAKALDLNKRTEQIINQNNNDVEKKDLSVLKEQLMAKHNLSEVENKDKDINKEL